jgi:hypothetical protein
MLKSLFCSVLSIVISFVTIFLFFSVVLLDIYWITQPWTEVSRAFRLCCLSGAIAVLIIIYNHYETVYDECIEWIKGRFK